MFVADIFTMEAVFIETLVNDAFVDTCSVLVTFVKQALVVERLTIEAVFIDTLLKVAFVDN